MGRAVNCGPPDEVSNVVWAQVGDYFADVRVPVVEERAQPVRLCHLDGPQAFSGVLTYARDVATWRHDLDTHTAQRDSEDTAVLKRKGNTIVERGSGYLEYWKLAGRGPAEVLERSDRSGSPTVRIVVVGELIVSVWSGRGSGGAILRFEEDGWEVEAYVGTGSIPWPAVTEIRAGRVPPGWSKVA